MDQRELGRSGLRVSPVGFGAGALGEVASDREAEALLRSVIDLGITLIDTARSYGASEERIGRLLPPPERQRLVLSTKGGYGVDGVPDWTYEVILRGIERALATMRTEVLDLFHLHSCPLETLERGDVVRALEDAKRAGKIRVAAYSGENEALAWAVRSGVFGSVQCSVNVVDQRSLREQVAEASARGVGVLAKRPLANAVWRHPERPSAPDQSEYWTRLRAFGEWVPPGGWEEVAIRFAAHAPGVASVLVGTRNPAHLAAAVRSVERGPLANEVAAAITGTFDSHGGHWSGLI